MKKKFIITEVQARRILTESDPCTSWLATQASLQGKESCCDMYLANPSQTFPKWCDASWTPSGGPGSDGWKECCKDDNTGTYTGGDDPCKDPEYNGEECFVCREPGPLGCQSLAALGLTVASAAPSIVYNDVNVCNATEKCIPDDRGDDPCSDRNTAHEDCFWCHPEMGTGCVPVGTNVTYAFTNGYTLYQNPADCALNEPNCGDDEPCPPQDCGKNQFWDPVKCECVCDLWLSCKKPQIFNPQTCLCECKEGVGEKGCKKGSYWSTVKCCCVDNKTGECVPDNTSGNNITAQCCSDPQGTQISNNCNNCVAPNTCGSCTGITEQKLEEAQLLKEYINCDPNAEDDGCPTGTTCLQTGIAQHMCICDNGSSSNVYHPPCDGGSYIANDTKKGSPSKFYKSTEAPQKKSKQDSLSEEINRIKQLLK